MKILKQTAFFIMLIATVCFLGGCEESHIHAFGEWQIAKAPTCTEAGLQERYCSCGEKQESVIAEKGHTPSAWKIDKEATCTEPGIKHQECLVCGEIIATDEMSEGHLLSEWIIDDEATCAKIGKRHRECLICKSVIESEVIERTNSHIWGEEIIKKEATCLNEGVISVTCTVCGKTEEKIVSALGHQFDSKGKCIRCNKQTLSMTDKQITDSRAVEEIRYSVYEYSYSDECKINIALRDKKGYNLEVPVYVDVKIINEDNKTVYSDTLIKKASESFVSIDYTKLPILYTNLGTLYYTVYNDYFSFDQFTHELESLPWTVDVKLNVSLPKSISYVSSYLGIRETCSVTDITFKVSDDDLYFYFSGEKTYDYQGKNHNDSCYIAWKLYDSEGYVVESGTFYTKDLRVGDKFKNEYEVAYNCIEKGETYYLEIYDYGL